MKCNGPMSVNDILKYKKEAIPIVVFDAVNYLLAEKFNGTSAVLKQCDIIDKIIEYLNIPEVQKTPKKQEIFDKHWLDFEELYREQGWHVYYGKPAYNETYEATFTFSIKTNKK